MKYTDNEFLICQSARLVEDKKNIFMGFGIPQIVAYLAKMLYAPNSNIIYEYGAVGAQLALPYVRGTMADSRNNHASFWFTNMSTVSGLVALGYMDYGFIGALQVDPHGNTNATYVRGRRIGGAGGANIMTGMCKRTVIVLKHEERRFREKLDFATSPGVTSGNLNREYAGLPVNAGAWRVVTSMALFDFEEKSTRMRLIGVSPKYTVKEVLDNMGFEPIVAENVKTLEPPTEKELQLLREKIDPERAIIGED
ncbi:MAG: acyl CoA--acetate/3-ketoacid CoA transferase subunit beta [Thermoproteota archaeon]|nr:MAG: acyl CoA--acetate/3-ketoacid CoA transferase subunit beta [Candidatus Korarchaeota archaeon]